MEHLFHPWHYVPIIAALPFLGALLHNMKAACTQRGGEEDGGEG